MTGSHKFQSSQEFPISKKTSVASDRVFSRNVKNAHQDGGDTKISKLSPKNAKFEPVESHVTSSLPSSNEAAAITSVVSSSLNIDKLLVTPSLSLTSSDGLSHTPNPRIVQSPVKSASQLRASVSEEEEVSYSQTVPSVDLAAVLSSTPNQPFSRIKPEETVTVSDGFLKPSHLEEELQHSQQQQVFSTTPLALENVIHDPGSVVTLPADNVAVEDMTMSMSMTKFGRTNGNFRLSFSNIAARYKALQDSKKANIISGGGEDPVTLSDTPKSLLSVIASNHISTNQNQASSLKHSEEHRNDNERKEIILKAKSDKIKESILPTEIKESNVDIVDISSENGLKATFTNVVSGPSKFASDPSIDIGVASFGKVTTTTADPISALLSQVEIVDVSNFIPRGYKFSASLAKDQSRDEENHEMMAGFGENINELLKDEEFRRRKLHKNWKSNLTPRAGKLNGKLFAQIATDISTSEGKSKSDAEENLYFATFGGSRTAKDERKKNEKSKYGWVDFEKEDAEEEEEDGVDSIKFSAVSLFESLLGNRNSDSTDQRSLESQTVESSISPVATTVSTTSTTESLPVRECGHFCSLFGNILITSGLEWDSKLLHEITDQFKMNKRKLEKVCSSIFKQAYFGSAFEFCSLEAFSKSPEGVMAQLNLQFSGIHFNVTSQDIYTVFSNHLQVKDDHLMMGDFGVAVNASYFVVVDTDLNIGTMNLLSLQYGVELPDWAWLVVMAAIVSLLIIGLLGLTVAIQRHKQNTEVKRRVLNAKTLDALRSQKTFDMVELGKCTDFY